MSLRIQHLNADATFLLTFSNPPRPTTSPKSEPFTLLIDPWLHSEAITYHSKFSNIIHTVPGTYSTLRELPQAPSAVLVTHNKADHLHEGTLKDFDWDSHNTNFYAVPYAMSVVRSWPWFPKSRLNELQASKPTRVVTGEGEYVEIEFLPVKHIWEIPVLHSAIGIKYMCANKLAASVLVTAHGSPLSCVREWIESLPEKKLDLLLHPLTRQETPLYLGGLISAGYPAGEEICRTAKVNLWVSMHDEEKEISGFVKSRLRITSWTIDEAQKTIGECARVLELGVGEEMEVVSG
jgi:hypothetical protein